MARKLQNERGQGRGWACGQMSQGLVKGEGLGGVLSKDPGEVATLGLIGGHAQARGAHCHLDIRPPCTLGSREPLSRLSQLPFLAGGQVFPSFMGPGEGAGLWARGTTWVSSADDWWGASETWAPGPLGVGGSMNLCQVDQPAWPFGGVPSMLVD